jgi:F0F1-type ATP synthase assembly protein I
MKLLTQLKTLRESHLEDLNKALRIISVIISVLLMLFSGYLCDYVYALDDDSAWKLMLNLYRLAFLVLIFTIKNGFIKEIAIGLLINHYIDRFYGLKDWTLNDTITLIIIVIRTLVAIYKKYKKCQN